MFFLNEVGNEIYKFVSKGTTGEKNSHLEIALIINKSHEQYVYAKSLKDPFFLLKIGIFNTLSMVTDVFYATLKTQLDEIIGIFVNNLPQLTKLLRIYQLLISLIFIVAPLLFLVFLIHIIKTLYNKIAVISDLLIANNISQASSVGLKVVQEEDLQEQDETEIDSKEHVQTSSNIAWYKRWFRFKKKEENPVLSLSEKLGLTDSLQDEVKVDDDQIVDLKEEKEKKLQSVVTIAWYKRWFKFKRRSKLSLSKKSDLSDSEQDETKIDDNQLIDLKNEKNNGTISNNEAKAKYVIGDQITIDNVIYDIIRFQDRKQNDKEFKVVLARNIKTGEIINFPYDEE